KYRCVCWTNVIENIHGSCAVTLDILNWGTHGSGAGWMRGEGLDLVGLGADILVNAVAMAKVIVDALKCESPALFAVPAVRDAYDAMATSVKELEDALRPPSAPPVE